ncbi:twin-arginine translocase subunit TatC [Campylobacter geochelonis]|uniref:Sec-independent protein translocase protein TatC n=1 Tax=Campylobacter geochelonis TaxID=1780362 RepID=A0A128EF58_9BACT|nr:twin-arginine translocase subunit TatC [Campylobacter geochelonis]QKF71021.1 twin arginine translocation system, TatC protein [Campylobacter geochelonis]CZE47171.1 twin arginine-targeting protein translocase TatC [Campylobacter geochelonis]CZE47646.1 twin arginine-targeting protein translocase TatC [Campylobacter geochelonis]
MFEDIKPHLVELRKRLVICVLSVIVAFLICFNFWEAILDFMTQPLVKILPKGSEIIFTQLAEAFFTAMKVSFFAGLLISMPIIFWQFWLFVAPGLYDNEKKYVIPFVVSASVMFALGAAFCYYFVIPVAYDFLINFGEKLFTAMPKIGEYVGFFTKLIVAFGISFELPVITFFLAKLGVINDKSLSEFFRYAIVIIFVFAAIMTPPDVLSQFMLAVPLVLLYGISILIAKAVNPAKPEENSDEEDDEDE